MAHNPFADPPERLDANPFADPSIVQARDSKFGASHDSFEDALDAAPTLNARQDDTASRLEEIRRREAQLAEREANLGRREEHIRRHGRNNFPPFYPLIYHDIDGEIPPESRVVVLTMYRLWMLLGLTLVANLVGCILLLISGQPDGGKDLGAGIMYVPVIDVLNFLLVYRPLYNALMKEHALFYIFFFFFGAWHIAFSVYMLVGIPSTGSAGLINTIHAFSTGSIVTGVFGVIASVGWGLGAAGATFEYRSIWAHYNEKGHTFQQAKSEAAQHGFMAYITRGDKV